MERDGGTLKVMNLELYTQEEKKGKEGFQSFWIEIRQGG